MFFDDEVFIDPNNGAAGKPILDCSTSVLTGLDGRFRGRIADGSYVYLNDSNSITIVGQTCCDSPNERVSATDLMKSKTPLGAEKGDPQSFPLPFSKRFVCLSPRREYSIADVNPPSIFSRV